jgi:phosphatidyl-myo-inositol dimannoside synthase
VVHGIEAWHRPRHRFRRYWLRHVDAVIAVSRFTFERFRAWSGCAGKPAFILPNGVTLTEFCPGPKNARLLDRYGLRHDTILLTLARLHAAERYKGIDEVLALMPRLRDRGVSYVIAGEGNDRPRLTAKARSLGLNVFEFDRSRPGASQNGDHDVVFTGYVPEEEKADHYRLADTFVMPGTGEGFGIVYLEALACGIPVIGSRSDASREVLKDCSSAFLVNPESPEEVEHGIRQALSTRRGVVPKPVLAFSRSNFVRRTHEILNHLLHDPHALRSQIG